MASQVIEEETQKIRRQGYEMLRSPSPPQQVHLANLNAALHAATTETVRFSGESPVIGKTIGQLNLRKRTEVSIIAAIRDGETLINPGADFTFQQKDMVVLPGESEKIKSAVAILLPDTTRPGKTES